MCSGIVGLMPPSLLQSTLMDGRRCKHPDKYELDTETHDALLTATEKLQQLLAKVTHITS